MCYSLEDIELMITNLPTSKLPDLNVKYTPQRRYLETNACHLPFHTSPRKIINCLIKHFQNNPIEIEKDWTETEFPYFLSDLRPFQDDADVKILFGIDNFSTIVNHDPELHDYSI